MTIDTLWQLLEEHQNETFYTMKKLPFTFTKATFGQALDKLNENPGKITGPKSLNVFGAPYVWAILKTFEIV